MGRQERQLGFVDGPLYPSCPDASTILAFRHFLEKYDLGEKLFERGLTYNSAKLPSIKH